MFRFFQILILLAGLHGQSQELVVDLAVEWRGLGSNNAVTLLNGDTLTAIPFLKVTYRNNTAKDIYFKKPVPSQDGYPPVISIASVRPSGFTVDDRIKRGNSSYQDEEFNVYFWQGVWEIFDRKKNPYEEHEVDFINDEVEFLNHIFLVQEALDDLEVNKQLVIFTTPGKQTIDFDQAEGLIAQVCPVKNESIYMASDLSERTILEKYKEEFVFLKQGEIEIEQINLIGFYLVKGDFYFMSTAVSLYDHIQTVGGDAFFPEKICGYDLYTGRYKTNNVEVVF